MSFAPRRAALVLAAFGAIAGSSAAATRGPRTVPFPYNGAYRLRP